MIEQSTGILRLFCFLLVQPLGPTVDVFVKTGSLQGTIIEFSRCMGGTPDHFNKDVSEGRHRLEFAPSCLL